MAPSSIASKSVTQPAHTSSIQRSGAPLLLLACISAVFIGLVTVLAGGAFAALLVFFLIFVGAALFNFHIGVLVAMLILPLSATRLMPRELLGIKGVNPLNGVLAMTAVAIILLCAFSPKRVLLPRIGRMAWMYVGVIIAWGLFGATHTELIPFKYELQGLVRFDSATGYMRDIVLKPIFILAVSYMLGTAIANAKQPDRYLAALFAAALLLPSIVIGFVASGQVSLSMLAAPNSRGFLSFLGIHANELGLMFNLSFALAVFSALGAKTTAMRVALMAVAGYIAVAVVLTFSRGAFLGLLTISAYLLVKHRHFKIIGAAVLLAPVLVLVLPQAVIERATTGIAQGDVAAMSAGRVSDIWLPLLPEVAQHPIIGQGLSSILWSDAARRGSMLLVGHPHSAYLGMLMDFGIVGSVVIIAFFVFLWRFFRTLAADSQGTIWEGFFLGAGACVLLLAVQGLTDDRVTPTMAQTFLWLSFGIGIGMRARLDTGITLTHSVVDKK